MIPDQSFEGLESPSIIVDGDRLCDKSILIKQAFLKHFDKVIVAASYKTCSLIAALKSVHSAGAWAEVVSEAEYQLAKSLGVPKQKIVVNGPCKSKTLLRSVINDDAVLNVDSIEELKKLAYLVSSQPKPFPIGLRIALLKPEGDNQLSRFGIEMGEELNNSFKIIEQSNLTLAGLHGHVASQQRTLDSYRALADQLLQAWKQLGKPKLNYVNFGGGFPWPHPEMPELIFPDISVYAEALYDALNGQMVLDDLTVFVEPGIALFNDAVSSLMTVVDIKHRSSGLIAFVDSSVHILKPTLHKLLLPTRVLGKEEELSCYDITGYTCLEFDRIADGIQLPKLSIGDRIRVDNVGAYTIAFKPSFIAPRPACYIYNEGSMDLFRPRETVEEMYGKP